MHASIRAMSIDDYPAVHSLWVSTPGVGLNESDTRSGTAAFLRRNAGMSAVAVADGALVGVVLCGHDGRRGYLHHLAVAATWRKRGIARELLAWCFRELAAQGIPKCNIFLFSDNENGAAFWEHDGWSARADLLVLQKAVPPSGSVPRSSPREEARWTTPHAMEAPHHFEPTVRSLRGRDRAATRRQRASHSAGSRAASPHRRAHRGRARDHASGSA